MVIKGKFFEFNLFLLSLWLLFVCLVVMTFKFPDNYDISYMNLLYSFAKNNIISLLCIVILIYLSFVYKYFNYRASNGSYSGVSYCISESNDIEYENLTFLTTYIIPLVGINVNTTKGFIILLILLVAIGIIHIKTDKFYTNPTLSLFGFRFYKIKLENKSEKELIIISKDKLNTNDYIVIKHLKDEKYYLAYKKGKK
ncbi:anti-phage protein KwaA [Campylobacter coli]|uniref:anti-phage protein KwaA n=1 Tax=Campylobacter coli TaxID=195 RepID=UPI00092F5BD2|nr:anti-phage protein KwaA [Campylobacter coli]